MQAQLKCDPEWREKSWVSPPPPQTPMAAPRQGPPIRPMPPRRQTPAVMPPAWVEMPPVPVQREIVGIVDDQPPDDDLRLNHCESPSLGSEARVGFSSGVNRPIPIKRNKDISLRPPHVSGRSDHPILVEKFPFPRQPYILLGRRRIFPIPWNPKIITAGGRRDFIIDRIWRRFLNIAQVV